jgi:hypothetical protein
MEDNNTNEKERTMGKEIMKWAEENYEIGGQWIVETMEIEEIEEEFESLAEAQQYCKDRQEREDEINAAMKYYGGGSYGTYDK